MNKVKEKFEKIWEAVVNNLGISLGLLVAIIAITIVFFFGVYDASGSFAKATLAAVFAFTASLFLLSVSFELIISLFSIKKRRNAHNNISTQNVPTLIADKKDEERSVDAVGTGEIEEATIIEEIKMPYNPNDPNQGHTKESLAAKGYGIKTVEIKSHTYSIYDYITMKERRFYILHIFHEQLHNITVIELAAYLAAFYEFGLMKEIPPKMLSAELGEVINKGNYSTAIRNIDIDKKIAFKKILRNKGFSDPNEKNNSFY